MFLIYKIDLLIYKNTALYTIFKEVDQQLRF